jgi:hypothetical protein
MRSIGFSTGALALGDFDKGLALLADRHTTVTSYRRFASRSSRL